MRTNEVTHTSEKLLKILRSFEQVWLDEEDRIQVTFNDSQEVFSIEEFEEDTFTRDIMEVIEYYLLPIT